MDTIYFVVTITLGALLLYSSVILGAAIIKIDLPSELYLSTSSNFIKLISWSFNALFFKVALYVQSIKK